MAGQPGTAGTPCPQCGSSLPVNARFCAACGHLLTTRQAEQRPAQPAAFVHSAPLPVTPSEVRLAGPGVRCCSFLLDLAAMMSPALPLSIAGAVLGVAEVVYTVVPVAFAAVWAWMQIWQGLTGTSFGKAMLGLRLVRASDNRAPGVAAAVVRSGIFLVTLGLAALPVLTNPARTGLHDRVSGTAVLDVTTGANPLGPRQQTILRRSADRSLNRVYSPVSAAATPRRG
ncbi:RDD family protein [Mycobacterium hubeiense]|uniref:RDD family protein n=1 Tax=Mycobacterium hubeiense TaxID=1867256 RepID=UPI000C7E9CB7|nr:RDD family protein [Mycobacterium sp. QGD 101]